jgi:hypothetical protein
MPTPLDIKLYKKAVTCVNKIFGTTTSAYRSMTIVKKYKELGGKYAKEITTELQGTTRWIKERWINVTDYIKHDKLTTCGDDNRRKHACRPYIRVNKKTPITIDEAIKKHGEAKILNLAKAKHCNSEDHKIDRKVGIIKQTTTKKKKVKLNQP